ncbi:MAG: hypothetical protein RMJ43_06350 [Chloroherpetonaceae bacterium]|nr:hypothetical protein [Chthonomonadaceae bacterium]MDW8207439.1 hypothetical protein [Chloroherpetonaceae bacterium]
MLTLRSLQSGYRRLAALLLTLAFLAGALSPHFQWECPDGTPCPPRCSMPHPALTGRIETGTLELSCGHCTHDAPEARAVGHEATGCTTASCVLTVPTPMDALRVDRVSLSASELALPLLLVPEAPALRTFLPLFFRTQEVLFPGRFLTSCTGRSPPVSCV